MYSTRQKELIKITITLPDDSQLEIWFIIKLVYFLIYIILSTRELIISGDLLIVLLLSINSTLIRSLLTVPNISACKFHLVWPESFTSLLVTYYQQVSKKQQKTKRDNIQHDRYRKNTQHDTVTQFTRNKLISINKRK